MQESDPSGAREPASTAGHADLLALALRAGGVGTLDVDLEGLVARRGGVGATAFGIDGEQPLSHKEWLALLHPDDQETVTAAFDAMLRTGARYDVDYRIRRRSDDALRWISVRAEPIRDGADRPFRLVGTVQDVTAQKQAEIALRESEARLRLAQRAAKLGSFEWLPGTAEVNISEEYAAIHGLPPGTATDRFESALQRVHPEDRERMRAETASMLEAGPHATEYRIVRASDGAVRWLATRAEIYHDSGGAGRRVIGAVRDVTDRRNNEAALRKLNEELEQRVRDEVAGREAAQLQLAQAQRIEAIGQLTGGIAHDFNNMIQGVVSGIDLALRRIGADRAAEAPEFLRAAREAADRAASLTRRLLAFGRRQALDPKPVVLDQLVLGMAELVERTVGPAIEVELQLKDRCWPVRCDANQLESALLNLAINARDAMLPAGGRLVIETAHETLAPADVVGWEADAPAEYVRITVADTGSGMPPDVLAHAFEPFFTTKPDGHGTGLGLSQIDGFVRQSHGVVRLESELGVGTRAHLFLARSHDAPDAPTAGATARPEPPGAAPTATVLLVEDEATVRGFAAASLRERGYRVIEAADGPAGLGALRAALREAPGQGVNVLVTDVGLPSGLNGRQLADAARALVPDLPVLLITGYAGDAINGQGRLAAGMQMLGKPFELDVLADRVRALLDPPPR